MLSKKIKSIIISITMCVSLILPNIVFASGNQVKVNVERLSGQDRYETNSKIVDKGWTSADNVILCNGNAFADAICASPLSKKLNAPILLAQSSNDIFVALQKIRKLGAKNVYILGGTCMISTGIEDLLKNQGYNVTRIAGQDRCETSLKIAKYINNDAPSTIFFTDGNNWQDALSIAPVAAKLQAPIILGSRTSSSDDIKNYMIDNIKAQVIILDDDDFASSKGVSNDLIGCIPISATGAIDMNKKIIERYKDQLNFNNVYLASNETFADALSGSGLAALNNNPIILYDRDNRSDTYDIFNSNKSTIQNVEVLGGTGLINDDGISNIFDVTGLVESMNGTTTNNSNPTNTNDNNSSNTQGNTNTNSNDLISNAIVQDYYSPLHEDNNGKFTNFTDEGLLLALHNNDIVKSVNNNLCMNSNSQIYGFLKLIKNTNCIDPIEKFLKDALTDAKLCSINVDSHKGLIILEYPTGQKLMQIASVAIEYNKDTSNFEMYVQNFTFLPDNVRNDLKNYGFFIISNNPQVYQDCIDMDSFNLNSMKENESSIIKMLAQNSNTFMYTGFNEKNTSYGKYINGLYVVSGKLNSYVVFISSNI